MKAENKSGSFRNWKCLRRQADLDITQKHLLWRKDWSFLLMCSDNCSLNVIAVTFLLTIYTVWGLPSGRISGNYFHLWQFVLLTGRICKKMWPITATSNARFWVWVNVLVNLVAMTFLFTMNLCLPCVLNFNLSQARLLKETACNYVFSVLVHGIPSISAWISIHQNSQKFFCAKTSIGH